MIPVQYFLSIRGRRYAVGTMKGQCRQRFRKPAYYLVSNMHMSVHRSRSRSTKRIDSPGGEIDVSLRHNNALAVRLYWCFFCGEAVSDK